MCYVSDKLSETNVGYKVLAYNTKTKKLYSSFTGQVYKIGKVKKPPTYCKKIAGWNDDLNTVPLASCGFYIPSYVGKSSAFKNIIDAGKLRRNISTYRNDIKKGYELVIVRVEFEGDVFTGDYQGVDIIAGTVIKSIEILKESITNP